MSDEPITTAKWRQDFEAAVAYGDKKQLAEQVGCSAGLVTALAKGRVRRSKFIIPLSDAAGIAPPEPDKRLKRAMATLDKLRDAADDGDEEAARRLEQWLELGRDLARLVDR